MRHGRPALVDLCPRLRHRARRTTVEIRRLVQVLVAAFPDSVFLARDPRFAEWMDSTPYDHVAADLITCARALSNAIAALDDPP
jgi:hypothetical protein